MTEVYNTRGAPWDWQPSLQAMATEVGVDFDLLIEGFRLQQKDEELAQQLKTTPKTIAAFRDYFERFGIDCMMGQD